MFKTLTLSLLFSCFTQLYTFAQTKDTTAVGQVKGILNDSTQNYVLASATIAVYTDSDSTLLGYQLSNNFGEFSFKNLPVGRPLRVVASYIGYHRLKKTFTIPAATKMLDLKIMNINRSSRDLQEVVISGTPPPVTMNGDTLEFNADAFKLDSNAVVEDLLRKLPGITVWGDGKITVNGKDVNSITVDGKPFFGANTKVAIQNLPKTAVQKIQVYQKVNESNRLDSTTQVNIKLKKGKNFGRFGKLATGIGSEKRFEGDAMLNFFSTRTQLGAVAASNNVNKVATEVKQLMDNASYKGVGASIDYQSDFRSTGLSQPNQGGFLFQHDFTDKPDWQNTNRVTANYYLRDNETKNIRSTESTIRTDQTELFQTNENNGQTTTTSHNFNAAYDKSTDKYRLYLRPVASMHQNLYESDSFMSNSNAEGVLNSSNTISNLNDARNKSMTIAAGYSSNRPTYSDRQGPKNFELNYSLTVGDDNSDQHNRTQFTSFESAAQNREFDRQYNRSSTFVNQTVYFKLDQIRQLIFNKKLQNLMNINFENTLSTSTRDRDNQVYDLDPVKRQAVANEGLTLNSQYKSYQDAMGFNLSRTFQKSLPNRYYKYVAITLQPHAQFFYQSHASQHAFQNISMRDFSFTPRASVQYNDNQYGEYNKSVSLDYIRKVEFPSIDQLVPLADNSNQYSIILANPNLRPYTTDNVSFNYSHYSQKVKHPLNYRIGGNAAIVNDALTDSTAIDELGRQTKTSINLDGFRYLGFNGDLSKAFKIKENQIEFRYYLSGTFSERPNYLNSVYNQTTGFNAANNMTVGYTFKDIFVVNATYSYYYYTSRQKGLQDLRYKGSNQNISMSGSYKVNKSLTINSNVNHQTSTTSGLDNIDFIIWNAGMNYRMLKEKTLELKLTALDILKQNTSIINYGNANNLTRGRENVLQQYFMVTLAYYPRKIGK